MSAEPIDISVIVPTLKEAENLALLVPRIGAALQNRSYEILIVDDASADGTDRICAEMAQKYPLRLHVRPHLDSGLSGAVLEGMRLARGEFLVVMDADLQHPPERLNDLIEPLERGEADFVLGSRHVEGGSIEERWGPLRRLNSRIATFLAKPFAGSTRDPMSGYFALRKSTFEGARRLTPLGYKIGLELMCKAGVTRIREVPIHFTARTHGVSKLTVAQQFKYLEHLSRLYDFCFPRLAPIGKFLIATGLGWFLAFGVYLTLIRRGINPMWSAALSYPAAILVTLVFHARYVRTQRAFLVTRWPWRDFAIISVAEWVACFLAAAWLTARLKEAYPLEIFLIIFGIATLVRYVLRKELMQDIRGLRQELRPLEWSDRP